MIEAGSPTPLGATSDASGTNFAVFSSVAEAIELCLFDADGRQTDIYLLPEQSDDVWHGYLPGCEPGQRYGYRVHGPRALDKGLHCNAAKLLVDPYARSLDGEFIWHEAVFNGNELDSAPFIPKSVVCEPLGERPGSRPRIPWSEMIFYEANVRGFTMRHPAVDEADRGTFSGLKNSEVIAYLKALGITSLELMPVHEFIDEHHLHRRGLRNFWGYNSISFFALSQRYARHDARAEFSNMVRTLHDANIEVILDVVYNHTGEGGGAGPVVSFRGLDNLAYYRTEPGAPGHYVNDSGCGNTINVDHVRVHELILDSLRYWHRDMGVDGFRFDIAPVLAKSDGVFKPQHPLLTAITGDEALHDAVLVAEPWGPVDYQLGGFPPRWSEWNDRFRDDVRAFWRGDADVVGAFARRLHGSSDIFESAGRSPLASVNLVSAHDGFTLTDVVSYNRRHNAANGEDNRDGHAHNFSRNHGVEGPTDDAEIAAVRRRQRLNLLTTLFVSHGVPLLLAGDEFGRSQGGNNNAYAQDNETSWLDWSLVEADPEFLDQVRALIALRREQPLFRPDVYVHGESEIAWHSPSGGDMSMDDWHRAQSFAVALGDGRILLLINAAEDDVEFTLPGDGVDYEVLSATAESIEVGAGAASLPSRSMAVLSAGRG